MKTSTLFFVAAILLGIGCSKGEDHNPSPRPDLPDPNDVCSCMDDIVFMKYCYDNFDVNKDGKVSMIEAAAVKRIDLMNLDIKSLTGIGYFSDLEIINCQGLSDLVSVDLCNNSKITSIVYRAFDGCRSLTDITLPENVSSIGYNAFYGCYSLKSIIVPESVTSIGSCAFINCTSLINITLPKSITSIEEAVFVYCSNLTDISLPESITSIGNSAFLGCESLISITLPKCITSIGEKAFIDCNNLPDISIPESVTSIGYNAFYGCNSLKSIYCHPVTPPELSVLGVSGFILYVPSSSMDAYEKSSWSDYYSSIEAIK